MTRIPVCFTVDVRQPWTNPQDCYFEYLIIRFDYLIIRFDYLIIGQNKANLYLQRERDFYPQKSYLSPETNFWALPIINVNIKYLNIQNEHQRQQSNVCFHYSRNSSKVDGRR